MDSTSTQPSLQIDRAEIAIVPRTVAQCLDLGIRCFSVFLWPILRLVAVFGILLGGLVYFLTREYQLNMITMLGVLLLGTGWMSVFLMGAAAPAAFGEPFRFRNSFLKAGRVTTLLLRITFLRVLIGLAPGLCFLTGNPGMYFIGGILCLFPGLWLAARNGYLPERVFLASLDAGSSPERVRKILLQRTGDLFTRLFWILIFYVIILVVVFVGVDIAMKVAFQAPILISRAFRPETILDQGDQFKLFMDLLGTDPLVLTVLTVLGLLVYPMTRLAWFFCYVDVRVRRDFWDLELQFLEEARRLEDSPT